MQKPCDSCEQSGRPLTEAAEKGHNGCLDILVKEGASVDEISHAFCVALENKNFKCAEFLWGIGIDVNFKGYGDGKTPLICAAESDQLSLVPKLVKAGASVNDMDQSRKTALCYSKSKECIELFIREGADVNLRDKDGNTPLHLLVAEKGNNFENTEQIKLLLEKGADVNTFNNRAVNALLLATRKGNSRVVQLLINAEADVNATHVWHKQYSVIKAASEGDEECLKILLQAGADVNVLDSLNHESALMGAACANHLGCVKLLLQAGAEVGTIGKSDSSTLHNYVVRTLIRNEVDVEMIRMLHAAGETKEEQRLDIPTRYVLDQTLGRIKPDYKELIRQYLSDDDSNLCLKHICRRAIREHLLQMSHVNLFVRVPHLGLPSLLVDFLLYDVSLESS